MTKTPKPLPIEVIRGFLKGRSGRKRDEDEDALLGPGPYLPEERAYARLDRMTPVQCLSSSPAGRKHLERLERLGQLIKKEPGESDK